MEYRREIDGLRAIAVMLVIFYHAGIGNITGGFIGVDVFFVISGFLITTIILQEKNTNTFSLIKFYERRTRRILPALYFVLFCSLVIAWFVLYPSDLKDFTKSLIAIPFFISNFLFWKETNYFATASEYIPLLHTWSLAVEEQYYLLFPLLLSLVWKLRKRYIFHTILILAAGSLLLAEMTKETAPAANFYLLYSRAWELMIGGACAFLVTYSPQRIAFARYPRLVNQTLALTGLMLISYSAIAFNKTIPFPSLYTLIPTIGSALIILYSKDTITGKLLSSKLFVGIGLISYSAYLWHYPIFAFFRYNGNGYLDVKTGVILISLTLLLAGFSWKYIEKPFREKNRFSRKQIFSLALITSLLLIAASAIVKHYRNAPIRISPEAQEILAYKKYDFKSIYRYESCFKESILEITPYRTECTNLTDNSPKIVLWGDSYAAALSYGLLHYHKNTAQLTSSGCPPIIEYNNPQRKNCSTINSIAINEIKELKPEIIILHAQWLYAAEFVDEINLKKTIEKIEKVSPESHVYVLGNVPEWKPDLPTIILRNKINTQASNAFSLDEYMAENLEKIDQQINKNLTDTNAEFISAINLLCTNHSCPVIVKKGNEVMPSAWDHGHLTKNGSLLLADKLLQSMTVNN